MIVFTAGRALRPVQSRDRHRIRTAEGTIRQDQRARSRSELGARRDRTCMRCPKDPGDEIGRIEIDGVNTAAVQLAYDHG